MRREGLDAVKGFGFIFRVSAFNGTSDVSDVCANAKCRAELGASFRGTASDVDREIVRFLEDVRNAAGALREPG